MEEKYILGVKISSTTKQQLLMEIEKKIKLGSKFSITTVGPELLIVAQKNSMLKKVLNNATFSIADGIGLAQASKFLSFKSRNLVITLFEGLYVGIRSIFDKKFVTDSLEVIKGRELFLDLVKLANKNSWNVFLLGGLEDEAEIALQSLVKRYKDIKILSKGGKEITTNLQKDIVDKINKFSPNLLFIAFGHPDQEIFVQKYLNRLNVRGIMTVGGTFNYMAGNSKLPPRWMEGWGEWIWRLITEPKRFVRIFNAWPRFPIEVWKYRLMHQKDT